MRSLTTKAPVEPSLRPIERASVVSGSLWVAMTQMSASMTPSLVSTPVSLPPLPTKPVRPTPKCRCAAELGEALLHRLGDLRVGDLREQPGVLVDQVGLDAAVGQGGQHLHAERPGLEHDGLPDVVERLVELDRRAGCS